MSVTRLYRLLEIITLLRSGRRYDADALADELEVSRRTIFRDFNLLTMAGVPYYFDPEARTYGIKRSFFLPPVNFTLDEALSLLLATRKLISQQRTPLFHQATQAAVKIESILPGPLQEHCGSVLDHVEVRWPPAVDDQNLDERFAPLRIAITEDRKALIDYKSLFEAKFIRTVISPYKLMFIERAWYVIGYSSEHQEVRTFKLLRIVNIELLEEKFCPDPEFSIEQYLGHAWVMIPKGKLCNVQLIFKPKVANNVAEVCWHHTQRNEFLADGSLKFEVDVAGIDEISWWILGYGDQVKVARPAELQLRIKQVAQNMLRLYQQPGKSEQGKADSRPIELSG